MEPDALEGGDPGPGLRCNGDAHNNLHCYEPSANVHGHIKGTQTDSLLLNAKIRRM